MDIRAAEISSILKSQIANFGTEAEVTEVGQVLSTGDGPNVQHLGARRHRAQPFNAFQDRGRARPGGGHFR